MSKQKTFLVGYWCSVSGVIKINAANEKEAKEYALKLLENSDLKIYKDITDYEFGLTFCMDN